MRKSLVLSAFLVCISGAAQAEISQNSMFNCMNATSYAVDGQCTANLISNSIKFKDMQHDLTAKLEQQSPNVMATTQFFPDKMLIKIIALKEQEAKLLASVR